MKVNWLNRCGEFCRADFGTPKDFLLKALLLSTLFLAAHLAGWREYTTFLSGTSATPELSWNQAAFRGMVYLLLFFGQVLMVPILLIAAGLLALWRRLR